jgi:transposase
MGEEIKKKRGSELTIGKLITENQRKIAALKKQVKRLELEKEVLKKTSALLMSYSMSDLR